MSRAGVRWSVLSDIVFYLLEMLPRDQHVGADLLPDYDVRTERNVRLEISLGHPSAPECVRPPMHYGVLSVALLENYHHPQTGDCINPVAVLRITGPGELDPSFDDAAIWSSDTSQLDAAVGRLLRKVGQLYEGSN